MPILEYYSPDTHTIYQFYARNLADAARLPSCPSGKEFKMERMPSVFAVTGGAREDSEPGSREDENLSPDQQAAMMRLSAKMEGLNGDDPDPRLMGSMMREMKLLAGSGKKTDEMDEVIRRLEEGEDLARIEDQLESVLEGGLEGDRDDLSGGRDRVRSSGRAVRRDPQLYELREYL